MSGKIPNPVLIKQLADLRASRKAAFEKKYGKLDGHRTPTQCFSCGKEIENIRLIKFPKEAFCKSCHEIQSEVGMKYNIETTRD